MQEINSERFEPNTALWAFQTIQPSSYAWKKTTSWENWCFMANMAMLKKNMQWGERIWYIYSLSHSVLNTSGVTQLESTAELIPLVWTDAMSSSMVITVSTGSSSSTSGINTDTFLVHFFLPLMTSDVLLWTHNTVSEYDLQVSATFTHTHILTIHVPKFLPMTVWSR